MDAVPMHHDDQVPCASRVEVVVTADPPRDDLVARARAFADEHGLRFEPSPDRDATHHALAFTADRVELREASDQPGRGNRGFFVEYANLDLRTGSGAVSHKQPLARAIGRKSATVVDATAGLGYDSVLLAGMGYAVLAMERSPVIAALLEDGLRRARLDETIRRAIGDRLAVVTGDARSGLAAMQPKPDVIYIDPMYPEKRKKSALSKKGIRLVREIVGADEDSALLVRVAEASAMRRVVVKRPLHAEPLLEKVDLCFKGKLVRYDVRLVPHEGHPEPDRH